MNTFWLGTHKPFFLWNGEPTDWFISINALRSEKGRGRNWFALKAGARFAIDSGGFTELSRLGRWTTGPQEYVDTLDEVCARIGRPTWAAVQDHMCEPFILKKTGRTVKQHQADTIQSYIDLVKLRPKLHWVPSLQGFALHEYVDHVHQYAAHGIDLRKLPLVGVGSVCRRQGMDEAVDIMRTLHGMGLKLHGYGFKLTGIERAHQWMESADSLAWSRAARWEKKAPGHTHPGATCSNCIRYAMDWRERIDALWRNEP